MRVISGKAKGKKLKAPSQARPLTDRAKEALFNILRNKVVDSAFLDLFAGSGAVGIEALSRGAEKAVFVDLDRKAVSIIRENLKNTGLAEQADVYANDAVSALKVLGSKLSRFDLIFLGAPYDSPALESTLEKIGELDLLKRSGVVIAEHRKQHKLLNEYGQLKIFREEKYGETVFGFYEMGKPATERRGFQIEEKRIRD
ncbi:MAG: 16S rRNA (guanine(966)-N(2))-methyltransferase RsmD [Candidatus Margulisiibacteriota bacterium]